MGVTATIQKKDGYLDMNIMARCKIRALWDSMSVQYPLWCGKKPPLPNISTAIVVFEYH